MMHSSRDDDSQKLADSLSNSSSPPSHPIGEAKTNIQVGSALKDKQSEWSELLDYSEIEVDDIPDNKIRDDSLRCQLAALYFMDAANGRQIDFPHSPLEVLCYQFSRSSLTLNVISVAMLVQMILPFLTQPYCAWTSNDSNIDVYGSSDSSNYMSRHNVWIINSFCLVIYLVEVAARYYAGHSVRSFRGYFKDKWLLFRLFGCFAMIGDYWGSREGGVFTLSTALIPFVYIARRHSLREIVEGVIFAARNCVDVFLLLLFLLLLWSFIGFMVFHHLHSDQEENDRYSKFDNLTESFYMCIQTFATRGFLPFVLQPYYHINPVSTLFFVSLTIVTDILCTALIIATGNRQYRVHANNIFDQKLKCRKQAVIAAYKLLCPATEDEKIASSCDEESLTKKPSTGTDDTEPLKNCLVDRDKWVAFCQHVPATRVTLTVEKIHMLFNLECDESNGDTLNIISFFKLCSTLDAKYFIGVAGLEKSNREVIDAKFLSEDVPTELSSNGNVTPTGSPERTTRKKSSSYAESEGSFGGMKLSESSRSSFNDAGRTSDLKRKSHRKTIMESQRKKDALLRRQIRDSAVSSQPSFDDKRMSSIASESSFSERYESSVSNSDGNDLAQSIFSGSKRIYHVYKFTQLLFRHVLKMGVDLEINFVGKVHVNFFDTIVVVMRLLLVAVLLALCDTDPHFAWFVCWWLLELYFWGEMIFLLLACGWKKYIKNRGLGIPIIVNVMSFILMCFWTKRLSRKGRVYILTVLIQSIRLPSLVMQYKAASVFNSIIPLVFRVVFITFAVIYFFSAIAFNRYCGVLDADLVNREIAEGVDDFIAPWVPYSQELNFRTFGGSMFTLFELSILGNWSSIMNSARVKEEYPPMFFFFFFRLLMMLCVYPILNSFIIAAYIARKDMQAKQQEKLKEENETRVRLSSSDSGTFTNSRATVGGDVELKDISAHPSFDSDDNAIDHVLEINIPDVKSDSMISFWSATGTERYVSRRKTSVSSNEIVYNNELKTMREEISWRDDKIKHLEEQLKLKSD